MKKYIGLLILGLSLSSPAFAEWDTSTCTNRGGKIVTGSSNNQKFCRSNAKMNWWSANVWCQKHGGQLADIANACPGASLSWGSSCDNIPYSLDGIPDGNFGWLKHTQLTETAGEAWSVSKHGGWGVGLVRRSFEVAAYALCEQK